MGTDGPGLILVGVDGSPTSLRAAAYAAGLARRQHARLVAVYVHQPPIAAALATPSGAAVTAAARQAGQEIEADLRQALHRYAQTWGIDGCLVVRAGDPVTVLTDLATQAHADAIIVGSSASVARRIAGSVATRLVRTRRWPVTVVP